MKIGTVKYRKGFLVSCAYHAYFFKTLTKSIFVIYICRFVCVILLIPSKNNGIIAYLNIRVEKEAVL
jgi:hypothetical protein